MKKIRIGLFAALIIFVFIQFFRPVKNQSTKAAPDDISRLYAIPANVQTILQSACYDCHSNNTRYPWYADMQPVAWFLADHIKEGKQALNFNEYGGYSLKRQWNKLKRMKEQITSGKMPLRSYTLLHADARLTVAQQRLLTNWVDSTLSDNASPRTTH